MSRHWNPKGELAHTRGARPKAQWPEGATAGLIVVAAACVGIAVLLYKVAGPQDLFTR